MAHVCIIIKDPAFLCRWKRGFNTFLLMSGLGPTLCYLIINTCYKTFVNIYHSAVKASRIFVAHIDPSQIFIGVGFDGGIHYLDSEIDH
jgi:hypothetical protein